MSNINFFDYITDDSFNEGSSDRFVRIVCFSTITFAAPITTIHHKIGKCHCFMLYGKIGYFPGIVMSIYSTMAGVNMTVESCDLTEKKTPEGFWLVMLIPYDNKSKQVDYLEDEIVGMFALYFGQSYTFNKMFTNDFNFPNKELQMFGPSIENPELAHILNVNSETISEYESLIQSLHKSDLKIQSTVLATLRWYKKATNQYGVTSFVFLWTALEIIGKDGSQDLLTLKKKLMHKYSLNKVEFEKTFYIGHLESFRGKVLHNGVDKPIDGLLLDYIKCLIEDLVIDTLSNSQSHRAKSFIDANRNKIIQIIDSY